MASKFQSRFGAIKTIETLTSAKGAEYVRGSIDAGKFVIGFIAFKPELVAQLKDAPVGEKIWAFGPVESNTREVEGVKKTYRTVVVQKLRLGEKPAAAEGEAQVEDAVVVDEMEEAFAA
jgi:hypothetical protein